MHIYVQKYKMVTSELVITEAALGAPTAAKRRIDSLRNISKLEILDNAKHLAARLVADGGIPVRAEADALHVAIACVHEVDYLLTWNCKHIDNAITKPIVRSICAIAGYQCPEICTPLELLSEENENV